MWACARSELRQRWKATVVLAVLVSMVGGVAMFGVAGYRRTSSALDRFLAFTRPVDAFVYGEDLDLAAVEALPQVVDADTGAYFLMAPSGPSGEPDLDLGINPFSSGRGRLLTSTDRPLVVTGRLPDPTQAAEVVVNEELAEARGLGPGDSLVMWGYAADQFFQLLEGDAAFGKLQPGGPRLDLRVTGVVRHPRDVTPYASDDEVVYLSKQNLFLTPAFHQRYVDEIANFNQITGEALGVRLAGGKADVVAFKEAVRGLPGGTSSEVDRDTSAYQALEAGQRAIDLQALALLVFAALVAVAGAAVAGQSLNRQVQLAAADHPALAALGMTPHQLVAVLAVPALVVAVAGVALAVALAVALSPLAPIGVAQAAEVAPGLAVNLPVLALGGLTILVAVVARTALPAWRASLIPAGTASWSPTASRRRPSRLAERLAAAGASPSTVAGVRMALEPGRGGVAVPVRTALAGTAVAVVAGAAALTFAVSLDNLLATPVLQGWSWDVVVGDGNVDNLEKGQRLLPASPVVSGFTAVSRPAVVQVGGIDIGVSGLLEFDGNTGPEVLDGRLPEQQGEIALGTKTMERLGAEVGDQLEVTGEGIEQAMSMEVVGMALVGHPAMNFEVGLGHGSVVSFETMEALFGEVQTAGFLVDYVDGVDPAEAFVALQADWGKTVLRHAPPDQVENLRRVGDLPVVFAGLLATLAVATLGHTLVTAVRRRRHELATLKTVGFVPRQVAATVAWLATSLIVVALAVGLPLGVAAGRWGWTVVADGIGTPAAPVTPTFAVLVAIPLALLVANSIAAFPARAAARVRPAVALRAE